MNRLLLLLPLVLLAGCSFAGIGSDLGRGLTGELASRSDTIGAALAGGGIRSVRDTVIGDVMRSGLTRLVDSIVAVAGSGVNRQAVGLRDSILNARTYDWLVGLEKELAADLLGLERDITTDLVLASAGVSDNLLGENTRRRIGRLRDELLGASTLMFAAALRDTMIGPEFRREIGLLRDELLGERTRLAIDSILVGAGDRIREVTRGEESFLKRNITEILWTAGGIIALLLVVGAIIGVKVRRYRKMLELLTYQIHEVPDRKAYDDLTARIQSRAQELGLEPKLRELLKDQGLAGEASWGKKGVGSRE